MFKEYVLAYDVGTSSVKGALVDNSLNICAVSFCDYPLYNPQIGWAEQVPNDYWKAIVQVTGDLLAKSGIDKSKIKSISFSCQAMGIIPISEGGEVLHRNISWVDGRAKMEAQELNKKLGVKKYSPKSVVPKLMWIKKNLKSIYDNTAYFIDVNGFLKYKTTGKIVFEKTGACSYAYDLLNFKWDMKVLEAAEIDRDKLPPIVSSEDIVGTLTRNAAESLGLDEGVIVVGGCNDVEAAAMGSGAINDGEAHIYLGSSAWICVASSILPSYDNGFTVSKGPTPEEYLLKGVMQSSGMTIDNMMKLLYSKELQCGDVFSIIEEETRKITAGSDNLIVTPWIYGETCPITSESIRSTIFNFSNIHNRAHLMKATREGVGYNLRWIYERIRELYDFSFESFNVVGGGGLSEDWMQCLADIMGIPLNITDNTRHAGTIGVAICALIGRKIFSGFEEGKSAVKFARTYYPHEKNMKKYEDLYVQFKQLYDDLYISYNKISI